MTVEARVISGDTMLATGLPPGWIEMAAFRNRRAARGFIESQIEVDAELFSDEQRDLLINTVAQVHDMLQGQGWLQFGAVVTHVPVEQEILPTVWCVGVGLVRTPEFGDINPIGVAERSLGRLGTIESVQDFKLEDGREGIVLGTSTSIDLADFDFDPREYISQFDPDALGVYICLLPVADLPDHIGLTIGVAPNLSERLPMSFLASQMAASLHVLEQTGHLPKASVLIDKTGLIHETGYLTADPEAATEGVRR